MNKLNHQQLVNIGLQWLYNNNMDTLIPKPDILTTELHTSCFNPCCDGSG